MIKATSSRRHVSSDRYSDPRIPQTVLNYIEGIPATYLLTYNGTDKGHLITY